jgi:hypothetical protein
MNLFTSLCTPAKIYAILAVTGVIATLFNIVNLPYLIISIIWIPLWTMFLNWICNKGYTVISWFLVLLPLLSIYVIGIAALIILETNQV